VNITDYFGTSGVRALRCSETKCPLYFLLFFSFFSFFSVPHTFLPEEVIVGFLNFSWGFNSQFFLILAKYGVNTFGGLTILKG
jgi:hypothetical protein